MPETNKNTPVEASPRIDFDEWAALAKSDPEAFENRRISFLEKEISRSNPEQQQRLRCLQWRIDRIRDLSANPMAACIKISNMMWDSMLGPGGLKDVLENACLDDSQPQEKARILNFRQSSR